MSPDGADRPETVLVASADAPRDAREGLQARPVSAAGDVYPGAGHTLSAALPSTQRLADDAAPFGAIRELRQVPEGAEPRHGDEFAGRFAPDEDIRFGDGLVVKVRHYGVADFEPFDGPTALVIHDDDDFSAYLRDADRAWNAGVFANYVTHPQAAIANLSALGGSERYAGPRHRLYIDDDGIVRTSPSGRGLGLPEEGLPTIDARWQRYNSSSSWPDACALDEALPDSDRTAALWERPWMRRYVTVLRAVRLARLQERIPSRVSGFGGRLCAGLKDTDVMDPADAPVLAQFGATFRALDPHGETWVEIDAGEVKALEMLLVGIHVADVPHATAVCQRLLAHGVARGWCLAARGTRVPARG